MAREMIILVIRTDKPEAEIGIYDGDKQLAYIKWQAHRELAETIHKKIEEMLNKLSISLGDIKGLVVYKGPGSFTGLRIGLSVANALAYSLQVPIVTTNGKAWIEPGIKKLAAGHPSTGGDKIAMPEYGAPVNITTPRK